MISSLVHFLLVELRIVYVFYGSMSTLIASSASNVVLFRKNITSYPEIYRDGGAKHLTQCVTDGVAEALRSTNLDFVSSNGCVSFSGNYFGIMAYITKGITCLLAVVSLFLYFRDGRSWNFRSGSYIAFTYHLQRYPIYQGVARLVVAWVFVGFAGMFMEFHTFVILGFSGEDFIKENWMTYVGLLFAAVGLTQVPQPILFYYEGKCFQDVVFKRAWYNMVCQNNDAFATSLQNALLLQTRAKNDDVKPGTIHMDDLMPDATYEEKLKLLANDKGELGYLQPLLSSQE